MNPENEKIARKLDELGQTLIGQGSLAEDVMQRIRRSASFRPGLPVKGNLPFTYLLKPALVLAASITLVFGLWVVLYANTQPAFYRQVKQAVESSDRFYQVTENISDDREITLCKLWYDRREGLVSQSWQNGKKVSEIVDDGQNRWFQYPDGSSLQLQSIHSPAKMDFLLTIIERFSSHIDRSPLGDEEIDGNFCTCYVLYDPCYSPHTRYYLWIDADNRIRKCEIRKFKDFTWQLCQRNIIDYDVNLDPALFNGPTRPGAARPHDALMVNQDQQYDGTFPPHPQTSPRFFLHLIRPSGFI